MENKFIQYQNKKIYYKLYGNGKPVVLLHGIPVNCNVWNDLAVSLQNDFLIITPDIPGSGRSEMLEGESVSIEDYAEAIKAILDKENISQCTMIGHSMGGYITLAYAEKYSGSLNGLGLFHSTAYADDEEKKQIRRKAIEFIKANGAYSFLKTSTPNLFAGKEHFKEMNEIIEEGKNFNADALIQYYKAMINRAGRTHVLKSFDKPVLFIIGEKDSVIPLQAALEQSHLPVMSDVNILDTGHMAMIEESSKSQLIVKSFLQNP
ncbi:MAG TPA: alpha/beta hydrolase [Chitinophagaceae bacterium]|nr:alpha/beta hydrolase [Chitinophagaceae bacterium]